MASLQLHNILTSADTEASRGWPQLKDGGTHLVVDFCGCHLRVCPHQMNGHLSLMYDLI